jgi:hypothetical protein
LCVHLNILGAYKVVLRKINFLCGLYKNEKNCTKITLFATHFFIIFFAQHTKNILFHENLREHIECGDIQANTLF